MGQICAEVVVEGFTYKASLDGEKVTFSASRDGIECTLGWGRWNRRRVEGSPREVPVAAVTILTHKLRLAVIEAGVVCRNRNSAERLTQLEVRNLFRLATNLAKN